MLRKIRYFRLGVQDFVTSPAKEFQCNQLLRSAALRSNLSMRSLSTPNKSWSQSRCLHQSVIQLKNEESTSKNSGIVTRDFFESLPMENKDKETYLDMVKIFTGRDVHRRGHVEFIYAALRHMEEFGVHKDLEAYKALVDVLPKGKFIPTNIFQVEFMHYPKQQQCAIDLLEQMEDNGVIPDYELESILLNVFGKKGHPLRKFWRMMYWMPKFKNLSPWLLPNPVPNDSLELAKLAMQRISSVDLQSKVTVYESSTLEDALDHTWIVSAQSIVQKELIDLHPKDVPVFVEGSFRLWLRNKSVDYFILRADPRPSSPQPLEDDDDVSALPVPLTTEPVTPPRVPTVHDQDDGTILAMCATGSSSQDSLLSWVRHLEADGNPALGSLPVLFTLRSAVGEQPQQVEAEGDRKLE